MWQGWINGILGVWLIVAAFVITGSHTGNQINGVIAGIVFLVLGLWAAIRRKIWNDWLVAIVGIWMFVAGFWFPFSYWGNLVNDLLAGVVVAIVSFWPGFSFALRGGRE